jgi:hypothetical protein
VIDGESKADRHRDGDDQQQEARDDRRTVHVNRNQRRCGDRNGDVVWDALLQAKHAGNVTADMFETEGGSDRCRRAKEQQ